MTGLVLALGAIIVAAIEVIALGALLLAVTAVVYAATVGRRSQPSSNAPERRLGAVGVPRQLERLDRDVPGCDR